MKNVKIVDGRRGGFSLVEMMIIVLMIGILAGLSGPPMMNYIRSNQMQTRTDRMAADLQYARAVAISTGQTHRFTSSTDSYTLMNMATGNLLRNVEFEEGVQMDMAQVADFQPWGMANSTVFNLSHHSMQRRITLLPTGMVEVEVP